MSLYRRSRVRDILATTFQTLFVLLLGGLAVIVYLAVAFGSFFPNDDGVATPIIVQPIIVHAAAILIAGCVWGYKYDEKYGRDRA